MDERRRRRLAVAEGAGMESDLGEEKSLPDCVAAEWCAAAPWIPPSLWKLWTLTALFLAGVTAVIVMMWRVPQFRPELAPALDPLFRGSQPRLVAYLETILWTLSGQLALLVGWHRSRSRLDFRGRYRFWPWAAAAMFGSGMCVATELHIGLGELLTRWDFIARQPRAVSWLLPAACLLLPLAWLIDRDVRRSLATVILIRLTLGVLLWGALAGTYGSLWIDHHWVSVTESACGLLGPALLTVTLWIHGWYVAYVTPDPPVATPWKVWKLPGRVVRWFLGWLTWPFRRRATPAASATARRRKKSEEDTAATRRKRKPKRKPRTRTKVVEEEEAEEEEYAEEEAEEETEEEAAEEESYEEEEPEPPARVSAPAPKANGWRDADPRSNQHEQRWSAPPQNSRQQSQDDDQDEDDDGEQWRADGPSPEQLKGLSKRQRRALIKQHRDQQRHQRDR